MKNIFLVLFLSACAHVQIPNFKAHVTLPASGDGYWVETVSGKEGRVKKDVWEVDKKRGIVILSEDWQILRYTLIKNCLNNQCKDAVGVFDDLFYTLDSALKATQNKKK